LSQALCNQEIKNRNHDFPFVNIERNYSVRQGKIFFISNPFADFLHYLKRLGVDMGNIFAQGGTGSR
jgi:hypothetical protein